jgi:hypothetical protein
MIELWSKEQIEAELPDQAFWDLWRDIYAEIQGQVETAAVGKEFGKWTILELHVVPAEAVSMVLRLKGKSLIVRAQSIISDITKEQVFFRRRMIPVEDYATLAEKQADPGVSTTFG